MSIPKTIHYFWFGGKELPELALKCIKSWKKYCPDFKLKLWNESNFDIHCCKFVEEAYNAKKWAFVADYARFWVLNKEGGVYLETDSELLKPINEFLDSGMFLGLGKDNVTLSIIGCEKNHSLSTKVLEYYETHSFKNSNNSYNMLPINNIVNNILLEYYGLERKNELQYLKDNVRVYPTKYFLTDWTYGDLYSPDRYVFHYGEGSWCDNKKIKEMKDLILKYSKVFGLKNSWYLAKTLFYIKNNGLKKSFFKAINKLYEIINPIFVKYCPYKIKNNKIIFSNFNGRGYGFNEKIICEALRTKNKYDLVWVVADLKDDSIPSDVRKVRSGSLRFFYEMATSKVWVDNVRKDNCISKRPGQFYLQTWHGSIPLKRLEKDAISSLSGKYIKMAQRDSQMVDLMISSCKTRTELIKRSFWYDGEIMECGNPRLDIFFNPGKILHSKSIVYEKLGIKDLNTKLLVYAPTFRQNHSLEAYNIDYSKLKISLEKKFGGNFIIVVRLHPNLNDLKEVFKNFDVIDATNYADPQELFASCFALISDYSDCLFEASLDKKPVFIYASDIDSYMSDRNFYCKLEELPFPFATNNDELADNIASFSNEKYVHNLENFWQKEGLFENGHATERLVEWIEEKCRQ